MPTKKQWDKALQLTEELWRKRHIKIKEFFRENGGCPLCDLVEGDCENCIAQPICNATVGGAWLGNERTVFGQITDARELFEELLLELYNKLVLLRKKLNKGTLEIPK